MAILHSVLNTVDAASVQTPVYHSAVVFAAANVDILRLVDHVRWELIDWDGPLSVSCSFPSVARFLDTVKLVFGLVLC